MPTGTGCLTIPSAVVLTSRVTLRLPFAHLRSNWPAARSERGDAGVAVENSLIARNDLAPQLFNSYASVVVGQAERDFIQARRFEFPDAFDQVFARRRHAESRNYLRRQETLFARLDVNRMPLMDF